MKMLIDPVAVGSHGFVSLVDVMGSDDRIIQAARISYGAEEETRSAVQDRHLLRYLMRHRHTTPFEQCSMTFIVGCPMDVWRQWIRHRTAKVNEYSTRYMDAIDDRAITEPHAWRAQSDSSKQGSAGFLDPDVGVALSEAESDLHDHIQAVYHDRLENGVAREQARKDLPLSTYTRAYWTMDLHNLFHFLGLRMDPHAQLEIRQFANVIGEMTQRIFPISYQAFLDYHLNSMHLSVMEIQALGHMLSEGIFHLSDDTLTQLGMSSREIKDFYDKIETLMGAEI